MYSKTSTCQRLPPAWILKTPGRVDFLETHPAAPGIGVLIGVVALHPTLTGFRSAPAEKGKVQLRGSWHCVDIIQSRTTHKEQTCKVCSCALFSLKCASDGAIRRRRFHEKTHLSCLSICGVVCLIECCISIRVDQREIKLLKVR